MSKRARDEQHRAQNRGIYVSNEIRVSRIEKFNANDSIALLVDIEPSPIVLVCVYRTQALTWEENQDLIKEINGLGVPPGGEMVVIGDGACCRVKSPWKANL